MASPKSSPAPADAPSRKKKAGVSVDELREQLAVVESLKRRMLHQIAKHPDVFKERRDAAVPVLRKLVELSDFTDQFLRKFAVEKELVIKLKHFEEGANAGQRIHVLVLGMAWSGGLNKRKKLRIVAENAGVDPGCWSLTFYPPKENHNAHPCSCSGDELNKNPRSLLAIVEWAQNVFCDGTTGEHDRFVVLLANIRFDAITQVGLDSLLAVHPGIAFAPK